MKAKLFTLCCSLWIVFSSCHRQYNDTNKFKEEISQEQMMNANKALVHGEAQRIDTFIKQHHFAMAETGTGLRYEIYLKGTGKTPDASSTVVISYKTYLLNDSLCYSVTDERPMTTRLGSGEQIRGLEEGLLLMKEGSRAHLVIPNHLAYGLTGDGNEIPPGSVLYFDVHLISVK